ncbi:MAG TPA: sugar phosphate isomerase/epimerase family protein [Candidatus Limnocylindria bacterium]|nr:sugar phosphate isomerase/epimerase family protein [Candidatus Limnocylindria bacterium]
MYRTAIITDEVSQDLVTAAALARAFSLDALEIRSVWERNPFQMTAQDAKEIKRIADGHGLGICGVASPLFKIPMDDLEGRRQHMESLRRACEFANLWGAKLLRGFPFMNPMDGGKRMGEAAEACRAAADVATDAGVTIVIESEPSVYTHNIDTLIRFLGLVSHPGMGALFDPGNEASDPDAPPAYPQGYERLKPHIRHVHIKDMLKQGRAAVPALVGEGSVDYAGLIPVLKREFDGYCSVETHYRFAAPVSEHDLVHPQGSSFSQGGEEASRAYLQRLRDVYRWQEPPQADMKGNGR